MGNLEESATWEAGIYQLERTDRVDAGIDGGGVANRQAKQLANRTKYLRAAVETEVVQRGLAVTNEAEARGTAIMTAIVGEVSARNLAIVAAVGSEAAERDLAIGSAITTLETALTQLVSVSVDPAENGCRLTTYLDEPTPPDGVSGYIRLVPYKSGTIALRDALGWKRRRVVPYSFYLAGLTSAGSIYDVFAYWHEVNGTVALELSPPWADDITRSLVLARTLDGVLVSSSDSTRRYIGTIRTRAAGTVDNNNTNRHLWNAYNQVPLKLFVTDATGSWSYTTAAWRRVRAAAANAVSFVTGEAEWIEATARNLSACSSVTVAPVGIGIDSTSVNAADVAGGVIGTANGQFEGIAEYRGRLLPGYHELNWLEYGAANLTLYGAATRRPGLLATLMG